MKGRLFLKVTGILLIIESVINIVCCLLLLAGWQMLKGMIEKTTFSSGGEVFTISGKNIGLGTVTALVVVGIIVSILSALFYLIAGTKGVKYSARPEKAKVCLIFGIIMIAFAVGNIILTSVVTSYLTQLAKDINYDQASSIGGGSNIFSTIISFVISVLYTLGALLNMKSNTMTNNFNGTMGEMNQVNSIPAANYNNPNTSLNEAAQIFNTQSHGSRSSAANSNDNTYDDNDSSPTMDEVSLPSSSELEAMFGKKR